MNFSLFFLFFQVELFFLVMGSCHSKWSVNTWTLRVLRFPKMKALKAKKTGQNSLFLSEEVTLQYLSLTGGWLHRGSCLLEEIIRNFIQVFADHNSLVLCLFPSKGLAFWVFVVTLLWYLYSQRTSMLMLVWICNTAGHWSLESLQGIGKFILQIPSTWFQSWLCLALLGNWAFHLETSTLPRQATVSPPLDDAKFYFMYLISFLISEERAYFCKIGLVDHKVEKTQNTFLSS